MFVAKVYLQPFLRSKLFHNYVRDLIATIQVSYFSIFSIISSVGDRSGFRAESGSLGSICF